MITISQYVGPHRSSPDWTQTCEQHATKLLAAVSDLMLDMPGTDFPVNPETGSQVSGQTYGGFRPQNCPIGASNSAHKTGEAVDLYDPHDLIDAALTDALLEKHHLYRESPSATKTWCHLSTRAPGSGKRTFQP